MPFGPEAHASWYLHRTPGVGFLLSSRVCRGSLRKARASRPVPCEARLALERRASDGRDRQYVQELGRAYEDRDRGGLRGRLHFDARKREGLDKRYWIDRGVHDNPDRRKHYGDVDW